MRNDFMAFSLGDTVAVNQVVDDVGRNLAELVEEVHVFLERPVRDVLLVFPHVRRSEELPRGHLVDDEVALAQGLHG